MDKNTDNFWTDELVKEFTLGAIKVQNSLPNEVSLDRGIYHFKKEKSKKEEPQWEILAYNNPNVFTDVLGGNIVDAKGSGANYAILKNFPINSVKRFPDNAVWSVGQLTEHGKISAFRITGGIMHVELIDSKYPLTFLYLSQLEAPKEEQAIKPPLGLIPMQIWNEHRLQDINEALERYKDANKDVPETWLTEKESLIRLLYPLKQEQVFTGPESLSQHPMCKKEEEQVPIKVEIMEFGYGKPQENKGKFYVANFNLPNNAKLPTEKYQSIKSAIEDVINNKYKPWKMYQTGFTSEELLQARRDAFLEARKYINNYGGLGNYESLKFTSVEDYINSLK